MKYTPRLISRALTLTFLTATLPIAKADLLAYWKFDETTGTTAKTAFGAATADATWKGTAANAAWNAEGKFNGCVDLNNATGDYFEIAGNTIITGSDGLGISALTISAWVSPDSTAGEAYKGVFMTRAAQPVDFLGATPPGNANNWGIAWRTTATLPTYFETRVAGSPVHSTINSYPIFSTTPRAATDWYHVVQVWKAPTSDGAGDGMNLFYVSGPADDAATPARPAVVKLEGVSANIAKLKGGGIWAIGWDPNNAARRFNGRIDDVALWDQALTEAEVTGLTDGSIRPEQIGTGDGDLDGMPNAYELLYPGFLNPAVKDDDKDVDRIGGVIAGALAPDGLTNLQERNLGTNPALPDTDGDGRTDGEEVNGTVKTDPTKPDTDSDGINDGEEIIAGVDTYVTDPNLSDSDGDTISDGAEVIAMTIPTDPLSPALVPLPKDSIIALYKLDATAGDLAVDSAGAVGGVQNATQNLGTIAWAGPPVAPEPKGALIGTGALDLDGASSIQAAEDIIPEGATQFSLSTWVRFDTINEYKGIVIMRAEGGGSPWGINVNADRRIDIRAAGQGTGPSNANSNVALDEWFHLTLVWKVNADAATSTLTAYKNALPIGTLPALTTTSFAVTNKWIIGNDPCCSNVRRVDGLIDDVAFLNEALTAEQVRSIYLNGRQGIGLSGSEAVVDNFIITSVRRNADSTVTLTWNSTDFPAGTPDASKQTYQVEVAPNTALPALEWADDIDNVVSQGPTTTYTTKPITGSRNFFRIRKN